MFGASHTYPADSRSLGRAVLEVARRVIAAEDSPDGIYPTEPVPAPDLVESPPFTRLIEGAQLGHLEALAFRILVAAELDRGLHRVLRRLAASDELAGTPVDGVVTAIDGLGGDPVAALRAFRPEEALVSRGLIEILDPRAQPLTQRVAVPPRVIDYLVTGMAPDPAPPFVVEPAKPVDMLCPMPIRDGAEDETAAAHLRRMFAGGLVHAPVWVVGPVGSGRRTLLAAVAAESGRRLLCVAQGDLHRKPITQVVASMWREILLGDAVICVHDAEPIVEVGGTDEATRKVIVDAGLVSLADALARAGLPVVFSSTQPPPVHAFEHSPQVVQLGAARPHDALALWRQDLPHVTELTELATRFRLPPGRIVRAVDAARARAAAHERRVDASDVAKAIAIGVSQQVAVLGTLVEDNQTWADIVLPPDPLESVRELVARVRHRHRVLDEWGFREKMSKGLGLAALFHGPPGTGKTMVANLIARELRQDLYQVDLSRIVSKWIGETEKNLARVFDAAEGANVMLLFDEADSLFSKRTEVKSSNDRHSNAEVNYLLQRVERFEGVCILTTNLEASIDQAFKRRLAFRIEFPMPDARERTELWRKMVPATARIAGDVDYARLAQDYELAGGNIRNAVLRAAYLAADRDSPITMALLERAVQLEYRDAGKLAARGSIYAR